MKKSLKMRLLCLILILSMGIGSAAAAATITDMQDVPADHWAYEPVKYVMEHEFMVGTSDTTFSPEDDVTRAMAVQILYALAGKPAPGRSGAFKDDPGNEWYSDAINWAAGTVTAGDENGNFRPYESVIRQQFALMLYQFGKRSGVSQCVNYKDSSSCDRYSDAGMIYDYAHEAMSWAVDSGVMTGMGDNLLNPMGTLTRAQMAAMIRTYAAKVDPSLVKDPSDNTTGNTYTYIGEYELTAYTGTGERMANGDWPYVGAVACNSIPLNTRIYIEGYGEYTVCDTGGMDDDVIDIYFEDLLSCIEFGRKEGVKVYIIS